ncbi:hypothetical protein F3087_44725 [Nocardia colli]|uniref:Uncharacterized protein n=1 Tax=Nocardia colli TaxID=2545717 RepID=A0A5N0DK25_9NOCA|nr:hypothetical protein [Nocardia colli]KAA8877412.1 hypothetical protein F3087_44725 [Nocardia colli]
MDVVSVWRVGEVGIATALVVAGMSCVMPTATAEPSAYLTDRIQVCKDEGYNAMAGWIGGRNGRETTTNKYGRGKSFGSTSSMRAGDCIKTGQHVEGGFTPSRDGSVWVPGGGRHQYFYKAMSPEGGDLGYWVRGGEFQWLNNWPGK